ncbi:MAG: AAA family ATPase, partial [Candidatus Dormibacteria bacterium]
MSACPGCAAEVPAGQRFCGNCGAPQVAACANCGAALRPEQRFCGDCGTPVAGAAPAPNPAAAPAPSGVAEVRLVSVLFVDLVGFTSLSESRDAEDMREFLSDYFSIARQAVSRHGGTIEKFIGDAVMAVWGAPIAHEDDAERAVRAGLELVAAVGSFGDRVGAPELRARGGVVTGRAASRASAEEGLVVGDRVNTASRVQSAAPPGAVLVDVLTKEATGGRIQYADAGMHAVKGKAEPLSLWQALPPESGAAAVDARRAGPLHGRDQQLAHLEEVFEGTVEQSQANLVLISGQAGVGKSRLLDELVSYLRGLSTRVLWHEATCSSYGESIAYGALSRMVRHRLEIDEGDGPEEAAAKLQAGLERFLPDVADREFVGPRLAVLLGLPGPSHTPAREEFFAAWSAFIAGLSADAPVVMAIDNLQWADGGLLDFLEFLLQSCAHRPVLVVGLGRPELLQRRQEWAEGKNATQVVDLPRLEDAEIAQLLEDLIPGMPQASRRLVVARAEGLPLYAVETVQMLTDRGLVVDREGVPTLTEELSELETPVSLEALIAARLDQLEAPERALVKDLSVLGLTFPRDTPSAIVELPQAQLRALLRSLLEKGVLTEVVDRRRPELTELAFAQTLLRTVAYDRLGKRERRARHLAVAVHLSRDPSSREEVAEAVAVHYRAAYLADRQAADADQVRHQAGEWLELGANRAAAVGAPERAQLSLLEAAELADGEEERLRLRRAA